MRIIGGKYKGRIFSPSKNFKARPTTDVAKEGLFNILNNRIDFESLKVLDLFAGTGSISYELISRGAGDVTLVELNFQHIQFIKSVLKDLGEKAMVIRSDAFRFINQNKAQYDFIFADPPYDHPQFDQVVPSVLDKKMLAPNGLFIMEHPKEFNFSQYPEYLETRKYGHVNFSFFENKAPNKPEEKD